MAGYLWGLATIPVAIVVGLGLGFLVCVVVGDEIAVIEMRER